MDSPLPNKVYPLWGSQRLILVIFAFFGTLLLMILRFNFSMAIVCMTDGGGESSNANSTNVTATEPEFNWDKSVQGRDIKFVCNFS